MKAKRRKRHCRPHGPPPSGARVFSPASFQDVMIPPATERSELYRLLMAILDAEQVKLDLIKARLDKIRAFVEANV